MENPKIEEVGSDEEIPPSMPITKEFDNSFMSKEEGRASFFGIESEELLKDRPNRQLNPNQTIPIYNEDKDEIEKMPWTKFVVCNHLIATTPEYDASK